MSENKDPAATAVVTAELKRLLGELRQLGGTDFLLVLIEHQPDEDKHCTAVDINVTDDHHLLDGIAATMDLWRKNNHPGKEKSE